MVKAVSFLTSALSLFSAASAASFGKREYTDSFALYGYGGTLGGAQLCSKDGIAYLVDIGKVNLTAFGAEPVNFAISGTSWLGTTNGTTSNATGTLTNAKLFVPGATSTSNSVGFVSEDSTDESVVTTGFRFYGRVAMHVDASTGLFNTVFFSEPTEVDGVSALVWNSTTSTQVVELRSLAPSNAGATTAN